MGRTLDGSYDGDRDPVAQAAAGGLMRRALAAVAAAAAIAVAGCNSDGGPPGSSLSDKAQLFVLDRSGGHPHQLTSDDRDRFGLVWSPRGDRVATAYDSGIELFAASGRRLKTFAASQVDGDAGLAWSPNGRFIAFETDYDNRRTGATDARLKAVAVQTGARRTVADPAEAPPSWAPDSRSLAYIRGDAIGVAGADCVPPPDRTADPATTCPPAKEPPEEVWSVGREGRHNRRIASNATSDFPPQLSPNGRRLVFARRSSNGQDDTVLWVADANGGHQMQLTDGLLTPDVAWAPNGRDVAILNAGPSRAYAFVVSPSGRRRKLPRAIDSGPMAWSPDGRLIAWVHWRERGSLIDVVRPDGRGRRTLTRLAGGVDVAELSWSPDGRRLGFLASKPPPED